MQVLAVWMISLPPCGIASRALTARLTRTCSIWPGSASTGGRSAARSVISSTCSPRVRISSCSTLSDHVVEVEHARLDHLLAGEREQLVGEPGGPLGGLLDLRDVVADGLPRARRGCLATSSPAKAA